MKRTSLTIPIFFVLSLSALSAQAEPPEGTVKTALEIGSTATSEENPTQAISHPVRDSGIGCATGAVMGSVVPGLGNAVGCVVGGLLGWWMS